MQYTSVPALKLKILKTKGPVVKRRDHASALVGLAPRKKIKYRRVLPVILPHQHQKAQVEPSSYPRNVAIPTTPVAPISG